MDSTQIREHMPVVGSDGQHIGTVDKVEGTAIKLTKNDAPDGQHHWIPMDWVSGVDQQVMVRVPSDQATQDWMSSAPSEATA